MLHAPCLFKLIHTGQHYDAKMSDIFFQELGIPAPDINLEVGSGSHAVQTANIMLKFEPICLQEKPDWLVVVGDVNSTMACTLVASKMGIKVAHVEAGLRSFDRTMPEEINRLVTDAIADLLLTPSEDANENLHREGVPDSKIRLVGNIMIDSLVNNLTKARQRNTLQTLNLREKQYVFVTLHRPSNVDHPENLRAIIHELNRLSDQLPIVFPMHPRTRKMLASFGIALKEGEQFKILEPIGYHDSLTLTENARLVLTDSGGLQEESTYFKTPCLTLRPNTERPITVTVGSNKLTDVARLRSDLDAVLKEGKSKGSIPQFWDGNTAERIILALLENQS
jgi:UDP-N-acetylglucosamine 2-epimerase (non-hydrolysing)